MAKEYQKGIGDAIFTLPCSKEWGFRIHNRLLCIRSRKGLCMKIVFKFLALLKRKIHIKFVFASWKTLTNLKKIVPKAAS